MHLPLVRSFLPACTRAVIGLALAFLSLLFLPALSAQTANGVIQGRVQNAATGDYLNNARATIDGLNRETFTDETGNYVISNVPAGSQTLRITYTGYEPQALTVQVDAGGIARQDVNLVSGSSSAAGGTVSLDEFHVAETREMDAKSLAINEQRYAPNLKAVIAADAFGDVSEGNIGEFIKRLPGVTINYAAGDASTVSLRGFPSYLTSIMVDGYAVPSASESAVGASRGNNLETISMSNMSRVEVIKALTPSMSADFLGGALNMITQNAFDRSKPELTVRGTLQFTSDDYTYRETPGPGSPKTRKLKPGYDISYVNPLTKNFGFAVSSLYSDQFGKLLGPIETWEFATAQGASETSPYLRSYRTTEDSRETIRRSYAGSASWRVFEPLTFVFNYRQTTYDLFTAPNRLLFNTGNNPTSYGPNFTQGRAGAGSIVHQQIWTGKGGTTDQFSLTGKYQQGRWKIDINGSYANSDLTYPNYDDKYFRSVTTRMTAAPSIRYEGYDGTDFPKIVEVRNAAGGLVDWKQLNNYTIVSVGNDQRNATDVIYQGGANARRTFDLGQNSSAVQVGGYFRERTIDRNRWQPNWTFVGADGIAGTADDNAGQFVDPVNTGIDQKFGVPTNIQWPDLRALFQYYLERPSAFQLVQPTTYTTQAADSEKIRETITAAYVQGEMKLLKNRLSLVGGVRFENTENEGVGLLRDRNAVYQKDASGKLVLVNGSPVFLTNDLLERAKLEYKPRGLKASKEYHGYYPSVNSTFNVTSNLMLRGSYGKTIGRPNFSDIIPNIDVNETGTIGVITARNPSLRPWSGKNYEIALEYYFKSSGVASISAFRKDIYDAFGSTTRTLTPALASELELDPKYVGYDLVSKFNVGQAVRIDGLEVSYQQQLTFLPPWARGFSVYANGTFLDLKGPQSDFSTLYTKTGNWGLSYSRGRFGAGLNWNYRGSTTASFATLGADGVTFTRAQTTLDINTEYRFTPRLSVFFNARNLTNALLYQERYNPRTPTYSRPSTYTDSGTKMSIGVKGTF